MNCFRRKIVDRILAVLISCVMLVGMFPATAFANEGEEQTGFSITVKDGNGDAVSTATVSYEISLNDVNDKQGNVTTDENGVATIEDVATYQSLGDTDELQLNYTISKEGWVETTGVVTITELNYNLDITLNEIVPDEKTITVTKENIGTGDGIVSMDGSAVDTLTVETGSDVEVKISPNSGCYIQSLTINGETISVEKFESYDATISANEDKEIVVSFAKTYTVNYEKNDGGTVKFNDSETNNLVCDENSEVEISATASEGYQISSITVSGVNQEISDTTSYLSTLEVKADTVVSVSFVKVYQVEVNYSEGGTVETDPECEAGEVTLAEGSSLEVNATPNENYRVSSVTINEAEDTDIAGDNDETYTKTLEIDKDYSIVVTFAPNTYKITCEQAENGSVTITDSVVDYDSSTTVYIYPSSGYTVSSIYVNGEAVELEEYQDDAALLSLNNICEDKEIEITFGLSEPADFSRLNFGVSDALRVNSSELLYVFSNDQTVVLKGSINDGIRITLQDGSLIKGGSQTYINLTSTTIIKKVELKYKATNEIFKHWHKVDGIDEDNLLKIIIDKDSPSNVLTKDEANQNDYYNSDVNVSVAVEDDGYYSGIDTVSYNVSCDGTTTQEGDLYSYSENSDVLSSFQSTVVVDSATNNSDDVTLTVTVKDRAGNEKVATSQLKINTTIPTINISMDGKEADSATAGYYNDTRTATITIVDRNTTFDDSAVLSGINITATNLKGESVNINKSTMLGDFTSDGDTHTANLTFSKDANYEFSISYENKAGVSNSDVVTSGDNISKFVVDKKSPKITLTMEDNVWNSLLTSITFGIWKNTSVTVNGSSSDVTSPNYDIEYYKSNSDEALSEEELTSIYSEGEFSQETITVNEDEQFCVYARVCDYAGNITFVGTNGIIYDNTKAVIELTPDEANAKGFHNSDVDVQISVNDQNSEAAAFSGIKSIDYQVIKDRTETSDGEITQEGNLYSFNIDDPTKDQLVSEWSGNITVDKTLNNSDNVTVEVTCVDNAGNENETSENLSINSSSPEIAISFDNNNPNKVVDEKGYYNSERIATITVNDRASAFNGENAKAGIEIAAVDSKGNEISLNRDNMISGWSNDGDIHTCTIHFDEDANYSWSLSYTNDAGNDNKPVTTEGSSTPFSFVVDMNSPVGSVNINENTWDELLNIITFGLFDNVCAEVSAEADDETSEYKIEYIKTSNPIAMTEDELDKQQFATFSDFTVDSDEQFVVYLKITDYAGNYVYVSSNAFIVDTKSSNIVITPEDANENDLYNSDVNVDVRVEDEGTYSGIKSVDYWVESDGEKTQEANLYTFNIENASQTDLKNIFEGTITVDSSLNNSDNVTVFVKTVDNAGNENVNSESLKIDATKPAISISYDNNSSSNSYFNSTRKATIVMTERTSSFDEETAKQGIKITAKDLEGNTISNSYTMSDFVTVDNEENKDNATHTITIDFNEDANYTLCVAYIDRAGNSNSDILTNNSEAPFAFAVDTTKPTATVKATSKEGRTSSWSDLSNSLTFGFWSNTQISIETEAKDLTTPIVSVEYYKQTAANASDNTTPLTEQELSKITSWTGGTNLKISSNEQSVVYFKITDSAGNITYISTDGLIVDDEKPITQTIAPQITINPQQPVNGIYNGSVKTEITVTDPTTGGTYSGLKEVSYAVYNNAISSTQPTQSGTLYSFDTSDPKQSELKKTWTGNIIVDSSINNSNDIKIVVYAKDNASNTSTSNKTIKIDTTAPTIDISFDNNSSANGTFFKANRTATIIVTERNFNSSDFKLTLKNSLGTVPNISSWTKKTGTSNNDDTTWTAKIAFTADGDYSFAVSFSDQAANKCNSISYAKGTVAPTSFTIDKTIPIVNVSYDNNMALNTNYYNKSRTATVVITERNFDSNDVDIELTANDKGQATTLPAVSNWSSSGDKHTAIIYYNNDADYTFDIAFKDKAGNNISDFAKQDFVVDKTAPTLNINGVENNSANSGDVIPIVVSSDTNYDEKNFTITLTGVNNGAQALNGNYSVSTDGKTFTFNNFEKTKLVDDIYTLSAKVTDKAGNTTTQTIVFSVNRFGSTYSFDAKTKKLSGTYVQSPEDIVISETNPNELKNIKITLFKNNTTITLEKGVDYDVQIVGGDGKWYVYKYIIYKSNFEDDGVYRVSIQSEDATGKIAENTLDTKNSEFKFGVDKTNPNIVVSNLVSGTTYGVDSLTVNVMATDNLQLESVEVLIDDVSFRKWTGEDLTTALKDGGNFDFDISGDSTSAHTVKIICIDAAGLQTVESFEQIFVTTNRLVRYYNNKPLFYGSIGGTLLLICLIITLVIMLKKHKTQKTNN